MEATPGPDGTFSHEPMGFRSFSRCTCCHCRDSPPPFTNNCTGQYSGRETLAHNCQVIEGLGLGKYNPHIHPSVSLNGCLPCAPNNEPTSGEGHAGGKRRPASGSRDVDGGTTCRVLTAGIGSRGRWTTVGGPFRAARSRSTGSHSGLFGPPVPPGLGFTRCCWMLLRA